MVLIVDDALFFFPALVDEKKEIPLIHPNILAMLVESLHDFSMQTIYDPERINDEIKMNRMLYEFEEISKDEYEKTNAKLLRKLKIAERVRKPRGSSLSYL